EITISNLNTVTAQNYPSRPIRIVTTGTGGVGDFAARLIAQGLTASLGQQAVVDNRPNGVIPAEIVAKAQPDGYTLLVHGNSLWIAPYFEKMPYDPVRDLQPVILAIRSPLVLTVNPSVPVMTVKDLISLAKVKSGQLNYASGALGSSNHLAAELFNA